MTLSVTFSDVPDGSVSCDCPTPAFPPDRWRFDKNLLWSNLNATYELEQASLGSSCFGITFVNDCEDVRTSDAIIIEDGAFGCCFGGQGQDEHVIYLTGISVCIECVDDEMRIASVGLGGFCECKRYCDPNSTPECGDWDCFSINQYPGAPYDFWCGLGEHLQGATACSGQAMVREMLWANPQVMSSPCGIQMYCDDQAVGTIKAKLGC